MSVDDSGLFSISDQPEDSTFVPIYNVSHVIDLDATDSPENNEKTKRASKTGRNCCWNCGDTGHGLRQCPLPPDPRQISKNRASFSSRVEFKRYHVDVKEESFSHLKPGVISDKLREALGLRANQLPMHIYRMRSLGYPPGWLLEARMDSSGIEMFDVEGNRVPNADEEEGEIGTSSSLYDESKIISYPGFNAWPDPGTLDETREYGAPDLTQLQSKEEFIQTLKYMNAPVPYDVKPKVEPRNSSECDMETEEIDEEINLLPEDNKCTFIPPLPDENDLPPPPPEDLPGEGDIMGEMESESDASRSMDGTISLSNLSVEGKEDPNSDFRDASHGRVKSIEFGTPALKIHSPFQSLPPPEKFRKDISDVINFENLPDSTGAYEKLKDVLKNVRSKLSVLREGKMNATI